MVNKNCCKLQIELTDKLIVEQNKNGNFYFVAEINSLFGKLSKQIQTTINFRIVEQNDDETRLKVTGRVSKRFHKKNLSKVSPTPFYLREPRRIFLFWSHLISYGQPIRKNIQMKPKMWKKIEYLNKETN